MKGKFVSRRRSWFFVAFFIVVGSLAAIRFGSWGIESIIRGESLASAIFCFLFAAGGFAFGCLSILIFNFNRSAFLEVDDDAFRAAFGWGKKLDLPLSDLLDADARGHDLVIRTKQKGARGYVINGLENAGEVCVYILNRIPSVVWHKDIDEEKKKLRAETKRYYLFLVLTIACAVAIFANIGVCVLLTDGKDLSDFTRRDDIVFAAFSAIEVVVVVVAFLSADRLGRAYRNKNRHKFTLIACEAFENREKGLNKYSDVDSVWFFDGSTRRIVIFRTEDRYGYMLEQYIPGDGWTEVYPAPYIFETYTELQEDISFRFSGIILEKMP